MMDNQFNQDKAKKFLEERELKQKQGREELRLLVLSNSIKVLKDLFSGTDVEVYLVGSTIQPYKFTNHSDVDIVVKNYKGDRFDLWTKLESLIGRNVEVIIFEHCHFQEHVEKEGYKVV